MVVLISSLTPANAATNLLTIKHYIMKKLLFFVIVVFWAFNSFAQNTLNVIDTGNITRERWRDSVLRKDMNQVPTGFLLE